MCCLPCPSILKKFETQLTAQLSRFGHPLHEIADTLEQSVCHHLRSRLDCSFQHRCRTASQDAVLLDFEGALKLRLELSLWEAHVKVNKRFRAELAKVKRPGSFGMVQSLTPTQQAKENTPRSAENLKNARKEYLTFIKSSQQFYRALIRALATAHGGIPELERVARRLYRDCALSPAFFLDPAANKSRREHERSGGEAEHTRRKDSPLVL